MAASAIMTPLGLAVLKSREGVRLSIGEAAAVAFYVAVRDGIPVSELPYAKIKAIVDRLGLKV